MSKLFSFFIANPSNNFQPTILKSRLVFIFSIALIITRILISPGVTEGTAVDSQTLMALVNEERSKRNLPTLLANNALQKAATVKSQDMIDRDYFAHQNPDGQYIWGEIVAAGYSPYKILGENLAVDFTTSEGMVKAWIDSPTHRENLLHPDFVHQGLAALYGDFHGRYTNLTTNLFGALAFSSTAPKPAASTPPPEPVHEPEVQPVQTTPSKADQPETDNNNVNENDVVPVTEPPETQSVKDNENLDKSDQMNETNEIVPANTPSNTSSQTSVIKLLFTIFGAGFLLVLVFDSIIIYRNENRSKRGHPSYHLFIFVLLVLVSLLVWWWG